MNSQAPAPDGTRRSVRVPLQLPIQLIGTDIAGMDFTIDAQTDIITRHGAAIELERALAPGQELLISYNGKETRARVVGQVREGCIGIAFIDPDVDYWGVHLPPPSGKAGLLSTLLRCTKCDTKYAAELTDIDVMQLEISGKLAHDCPKCRWLTTTERAQGTAPTETINRRKSKRTKVGYPVCIQCFGQKVLASALDVSRTGLRIQCKVRYQAGQEVQVATAYNEAPDAIFLAAKVVWVREEKSGLFEHGLEYL